MRVRTPTRPAGSAMLVALILLLVLTTIGVASVYLSSRERQNAASMNKVQFLQACATAAQAKIWAEMSQYGLSYLGSSIQVTTMALPDGTRFIAPAHYEAQSGTLPLVKDVTFKVQADTSGVMNERDCTNGGCGILPLGQTHYLTVLCIDRFDRAQEVELAVKFAL